MGLKNVIVKFENCIVDIFVGLEAEKIKLFGFGKDEVLKFFPICFTKSSSSNVFPSGFIDQIKGDGKMVRQRGFFINVPFFNLFASLVVDDCKIDQRFRVSPAPSVFVQVIKRSDKEV